jgi:hypothetical protein
MRKKGLGEVFGVVWGVTAPAAKGVKWVPIFLAEDFERGSGDKGIGAACLKDIGPFGGFEGGNLLCVCHAAIWSQWAGEDKSK